MGKENFAWALWSLRKKIQAKAKKDYCLCLCLFFFFFSIDNTFVAVVYLIKTLFSRGIFGVLSHYSSSFARVFIL